MFFIPAALLFFVLFLLSLPFLFVLIYFQIIVIGFKSLGISPQGTIWLLFFILVGSLINIPLTKKKRFLSQESRFFGLFQRPRIEIHYVAINVGGAIIPSLLSLYFLFLAQGQGLSLKTAFIAVTLMSLVAKFFSRVVPGKGIILPALIPPLFSAILAMILAPRFAAPLAFISGTLGALIGGDLLNLNKIRRYPGFISIGGAGIFDGVFLVGITSALLSGF